MKRCGSGSSRRRNRVAPRAGAWIETLLPYRPPIHSGSPPARGRGLNHRPILNAQADGVAPRAGAWIETLAPDRMTAYLCRPRAGAWIETDIIEAVCEATGVSPPARGRGLKRPLAIVTDDTEVAPRAGAWIETDPLWPFSRMPGHPPPPHTPVAAKA